MEKLEVRLRKSSREVLLELLFTFIYMFVMGAESKKWFADISEVCLQVPKSPSKRLQSAVRSVLDIAANYLRWDDFGSEK